MDLISTKISVIVATKNEAKNIINCLKSIKDQDYIDVEIIVVDNNSGDGTREMAAPLADQVFNLAEEMDLSGIKNYRGAQLNFGASKAHGDVIFFPDADMTFEVGLFKEIAERINILDALFIPEKVCGRGFFGKIRDFERSFYNQTCVDGVRIVKREVFLKVGGFDVNNIVFGPDDWDFTKNLIKNNYRLGITMHPLFHHEEWLTLGVYLNKKKKYINTFDGYIKKWGKNDIDVKKQFGLGYRYFGVFLEKGKWKKVVAHPVLFGGMYILKSLVGAVYLFNKK